MLVWGGHSCPPLLLLLLLLILVWGSQSQKQRIRVSAPNGLEELSPKFFGDFRLLESTILLDTHSIPIIMNA
jgi:hypothetical protein